MADSDTIRNRNVIRQIVHEMLDAFEPKAMNSDDWVTFWKEVKEISTRKLPDDKKLADREQWAKSFEKEICPFGKHKGKNIVEIIQDDPEYLDWIIGQPNFAYDMDRYLCTKTGRDRMRPFYSVQNDQSDPID